MPQLALSTRSPFPAGTVLGPDGQRVSLRETATPWDAGAGPPFAVGWGQRPPEQYTYPRYWNRSFSPRSESGLPNFPLLRSFTSACDIVNAVIQIRLDEASALPLNFKARERPDSEGAKAAFEKLRKKLVTWWRRPCKAIPDLSYRGWIYMALYETFVTDGTTFMCEHMLDGTPSARQVAPDVMKPMLNSLGIINGWLALSLGFPRESYSTDDVIAPRYSPRVISGYGLSHVEDVWNQVLMATKWQELWLASYTETTIPRAYIKMPQGMSSQQEIKAWYTYLNENYSGDLSYVNRLLPLPHDTEIQTLHPEPFDREALEAVLSLICFRFGIDRQRLMNTHASIGGGDETREQIQDSGLSALKRYMLELVDAINVRLLGEWLGEDALEDDVEAYFGDDISGNKLVEAQRHKLLVDAGIEDPDEARPDVGLDDRTEEQKAAIAQEAADKMKLAQIAAGAKPGNAKAPTPNAAEKPAIDAKVIQKADPLVDEERGVWLRYAKKRVAKGRADAPFIAHHLDPAEIYGIRRALRVAKSERDVAKAFAKPSRTYGPTARKRAREAISASATTYLEAGKTALMAQGRRAMKSAGEWELGAPWIHATGAARDAFEEEMKKLLALIWSESAKSARAAIDKSGMDIDWSGYDENAAQYASARAGELITGIDEETRRSVRAIVEHSVRDGLSDPELASELEDAFAFSSDRAIMIARTEEAITQNRGPLKTYRDFGVRSVQVFDGDFDDECQQANGEVWSIDEAEANPVEHPNCERSFAPISEMDEEEEAA